MDSIGLCLGWGLAVSYSIQPPCAVASAGKPAEALAEAGAGDGDRTRDVQLGKMAVVCLSRT
jgi:hypothetical protein